MDCLEGMKLIPNESIDIILCDLPYGTTEAKWDSIIPIDKLWIQYERIIKPDGAIVLTASQPFTTKLIQSNYGLFKYEWIWVKSKPTGFINAKNAPLKKHENVLVFSKGATANRSPRNMKYFPQDLKPLGKKKKSKNNPDDIFGTRPSRNNDGYVQEFTGYPDSILEFASESKTVHPTQKPLALFEYLIKTYTNEGDIVLDNCMGSGTTAVAALKNNRKFIGFETESKYIEVANKRIDSIYNEIV
nr:site-specific DNA-methyltransferase [Paenibacillus naphthalenovorans]